MAFSGAFQRTAFQRGAFQMDAAETYGGVGHYLEEMQRQKALQRITRRAPPPVRQASPPLPAPRMQPAIDLRAIAWQRARDDMQRQRAATERRRRQEAEILLLTA